MFLQQLNDAGKVGEAAGQAVDLVDDDDVDLARRNVGKERLEACALHRPARNAAVVVALARQGPAFMTLTRDIRLARLILRIEAVELLLEPFLARLAGVDGAAQLGHATSPKNLGPDQRVPVICLAITDSEPKRSPS